MRKVVALVLTMALVFCAAAFSGCQKNPGSGAAGTGNRKVGYQLEKPAAGEEIAVMETSKGTIKIRFFPEAAPKAVENFKTHAKEGYYDGLKFHRVIENFMIQGGDPKGNGTGGESIWGKAFEDEFSDKLFNITGSLSMANAGPNTNGSQFFINQGGAQSFAGWSAFSSLVDSSKLNDDIKKLYEENGGNPNLDGKLSRSQKGHTVFGQVFEGMDVVNAIASVKTDSKDKPVEDVTIKSIQVVAYEG